MSTISIISCEITKPTGKNYEQAEIAYKDDKGEIKGKKILSFSNPSVWAIIKGVKAGDKYDISFEKNAKGYWEWTSMSPFQEGEPMQAQAVTKGKHGTDFRSSEEIIRTSALEVAANICIANKTKEPVTVEQVISLSKLFVTYIRKGEFDPFPLADIEEDDIPE